MAEFQTFLSCCSFGSLAMAGIVCVAPITAPAAEKGPEPEKIKLWPDQAPAGDGQFVKADVFLTVHRAAKPNGAALVICPGGGYGGVVAGPEGHGIARWLNQHGMAGMVLEYRLPHGNKALPLLDAQRAMRLVRARATEFGCDSNKIGVIGFSAGGHLASTVATHFDSGNAGSTDAVERVSCRPDFAVLIYPVISMGPKGHGGSRKNLLGKDPTPADVALFSNELQVTDQTPPAFLAHAMDDRVVSPHNSKMYFEALQAHKIPAKYLELPSGGHGLNGYKGAMWEAWQAQALQWLAEQKIIPAE